MTGYESKRAAAQDKLEQWDDEALKLALEALRMADELCRGHGVDFKEYGLEFDRDIQVKYKDAITAIKEALAQPAQEPVAWQFMNGSYFRKRRPKDFSDLAPDGFPYWNPLYTTPPQRLWVDLTPQDLNEIFAIARTGEHAVRLALDKLKEKNNAA